MPFGRVIPADVHGGTAKEAPRPSRCEGQPGITGSEWVNVEVRALPTATVVVTVVTSLSWLVLVVAGPPG